MNKSEEMTIIELILDVVLDSLKDMLYIFPALYITYLLMEIIEHFAGEKTLGLIKKSKKAGPLFGALLGAIPECGISGGIANLYVAGVISVGAFIAAILSTSDEMLAILVSSGKFSVLISFLAFKIVYGTVAGFSVDFLNLLRRRELSKHGKEAEKEGTICEICERENCMCGHHHHHDEDDDEQDEESGFEEKAEDAENGNGHEGDHHGHEHGHNHGHAEDGCHGKVWLAALVHALKIGAIVLVVSIILGFVVELVGEERIASLPFNIPVVGELMAALIGLIPNCSVSVIFTDAYVNGLIKAGPLMAGLLANGGVGLLVFFRMNRGDRKWKKNVLVVSAILGLAVAGGLIASLIF